MELEILKEFGPWGVVILVMLWFMKVLTRFMDVVEKNTRTLDRAVSLFDDAKREFLVLIDKTTVREKNSE